MKIKSYWSLTNNVIMCICFTTIIGFFSWILLNTQSDYFVYKSNLDKTCEYVEYFDGKSYIKDNCPEKLPKKYSVIWVR